MEKCGQSRYRRSRYYTKCNPDRHLATLNRFALAEVDPAFAVRDIIVADKRDGKLLDAKEGPLRIVAPGDKRPARWVRQVTALRLTAVK